MPQNYDINLVLCILEQQTNQPAKPASSQTKRHTIIQTNTSRAVYIRKYNKHSIAFVCVCFRNFEYLIK